MCGLFGIATPVAHRPSLNDAQVMRLRDLMEHRGPDGAGLWRRDNVVLAHRRLAVIDPTPAGHQPTVSADSGSVLVYNGELYNDAELRRELASKGYTFHTRCDTETVLRALEHWGHGALARLRGMFALAFYDSARRSILLARDALGVKPLYYAQVRTASPESHDEIVFSSEIPPILGHPDITAEPDMAVVSSYLTTIRTTLGERTLFKGVRTLGPGESITVDLSGDDLALTHRYQPLGDERGACADQTRRVVTNSIHAHLRSDVPMCCMLSGGLDSSIIAATTTRAIASDLHTFCAGADEDGSDSDLDYAMVASHHIGSAHTQVPIDRPLFATRMREMIARMGLPLSTPNEVAINEVARTMHSAGRVVTLSGEGADELFAGYELPMRLAAGHIEAGNDDPGVFQLLSNAWLNPQLKPRVVQPCAWRAVDEDALLFGTYRGLFEAARAERDDDDLSAHLRFHRKVNLTGLLARLDTATMLESIESRTPFADREVAAFAQSLPMQDRYTQGPGQTKVALRRAFEDLLPESIVARPKASFPLPFREWMEDLSPVVRRSALIADVFTPEAIEAVATNPALNWTVAWPMINLAIWSNHWWPTRSSSLAEFTQPTRQVEPKGKGAATPFVRD
jgi:asparagine synthase (glutamine-hydrolysing)